MFSSKKFDTHVKFALIDKLQKKNLIKILKKKRKEGSYCRKDQTE